MGKPAKTTTTAQQTTDQTTNQQQQQDQTGVSAQDQASQQISQFLQQFSSQQQQEQQQQQAQQQQGTQVQTTNLSPLQQPVAQQYFNDLMSKYTGGVLTPQAYTGQRVAPLTPDQIAAQNLARTYATGAGSDFANNALVSNKTLLDPNMMLNPQNIPGFQASQKAIIDSATRNLTEQQLPAIRGSALLDGAYGGSRQGIAEGQAIGRTNEAITNSLGNMNLGAYGQGLSAMTSALGLAPQTAGLGTAPAQALSQIGAQNQGQQQAELGATQQQFQEQQAAPAQGLSILKQLLGTSGEYGGSTEGASASTGMGTSSGASTGSSSGSQGGTSMQNIISSMLGLDTSSLTGASQGTSHTDQTGTQTQKQSSSTLQQLATLAALAAIPFTFGASAAVIPAVNGSDTRLKDNIKYLRQDPSGLFIYHWDWKDGREEPNEGYLAQEVMLKFPDAVVHMPSGFLGLDYNKLAKYGVSDPRRMHP